jgi:hypothetical protein
LTYVLDVWAFGLFLRVMRTELSTEIVEKNPEGVLIEQRAIGKGTTGSCIAAA